MIITEKRDKTDIVSFETDKINALVTEEIRSEINKLFENSGAKVIINLQGVKYVDSSGFGCFLSVLKNARNNLGTLKFVNPEPSVFQTIETLNLHTVFSISYDLEACVRSMR